MIACVGTSGFTSDGAFGDPAGGDAAPGSPDLGIVGVGLAPAGTSAFGFDATAGVAVGLAAAVAFPGWGDCGSLAIYPSSFEEPAGGPG